MHCRDYMGAGSKHWFASNKKRLIIKTIIGIAKNKHLGTAENVEDIQWGPASKNCNCWEVRKPKRACQQPGMKESRDWDYSKSLLKGWKIVWDCFFSLGIVLGKSSPDRRLADALRQERVFPSVLRCSFLKSFLQPGFFIVIQIVHGHFAEGTMELQALASRCYFLCGRRSTFKCSSCKFFMVLGLMVLGFNAAEVDITYPPI